MDRLGEEWEGRDECEVLALMRGGRERSVEELTVLAPSAENGVLTPSSWLGKSALSKVVDFNLIMNFRT